MATINVSLPSDGTTADVSDVNTPINTIVSEINGNLDNANIKSSAAISGSKLADNSIDLGTKTSTWDGWIAVTDSWSYASATTVTVPSDATTKYSVGDRIKFIQSATTKYFQVTAVASTTLTLTGLSGVTVANAAISSIYYSKSFTPTGHSLAWQSWTPTWTNLTVGNGTQSAAYIQIGKTVHFRVGVVFGSTTSVGGTVSLNYPVTAAAYSGSATVQTLGNAQFYDQSTGAVNKGIFVYNSTTAGNAQYFNVSGSLIVATNMGTTTPFTWATSDEVFITGTYEAA